MLMFLVVLLVILWLLGMVTTTTLGGWLHVLLVIAVIFLLIRLIRGQPVSRTLAAQRIAKRASSGRIVPSSRGRCRQRPDSSCGVLSAGMQELCIINNKLAPA